MDPDETLKQLRKKVFELQMLEGKSNATVPRADLGEEIAELFAGLDEWLSDKGFLPKAWQR